MRKVGARKPVKNRTLQAKQSPEFRNSVPCSDNTCKKAAPCGTGEHGFVKPVQEAFEFGDRLKIGTQVPIEEGGRQRLRAQGPDQGLTFILVAERLEKGRSASRTVMIHRGPTRNSRGSGRRLTSARSTPSSRSRASPMISNWKYSP